MSRVPAPELEALIEHLVRERCRGVQGDLRSLIEAQIARITVQLDSISIELAGPAGSPDDLASPARQTVTLPWSKRPFQAVKGVAAGPTPTAPDPDFDPRARETVLAAIGKARQWVSELVAGSSLAEIAQREGKSARYIRQLVSLAFAPPRLVREIAASDYPPITTNLALRMPLVWSVYGSQAL